MENMEKTTCEVSRMRKELFESIFYGALLEEENSYDCINNNDDSLQNAIITNHLNNEE